MQQPEDLPATQSATPASEPLMEFVLAQSDSEVKRDRKGMRGRDREREGDCQRQNETGEIETWRGQQPTGDMVREGRQTKERSSEKETEGERDQAVSLAFDCPAAGAAALSTCVDVSPERQADPVPGSPHGLLP